MADTLSVANDLMNFTSCECHPIESGSSIVDTILAVAMVIIALANIAMSFYIFKKGREDTSERANRQRKFELIQTLILNDRLHLLYEFYDSVSKECRKLLDSSDQLIKVDVNNNNISLLQNFRQDFVILFNVVDHKLFDDLKKTADDLIDGITEAIFNEGINLRYEPKYNEMISEHLAQNRNLMLSKLCEMANFEKKSTIESQKGSGK